MCRSGCCGRHVSLVCGQDRDAEFSVFDKSAMNEAVQVSSDALIEDVSVVRLDASLCESENAYYIVSSDMIYRYAKDGSFVSSSSQSALRNPVDSISTE